MIPPLTTEKILEHAEIAATYFRALAAKGVPVDSAVILTGNYMITVAMREAHGQPPKEPWEGER